MENAFAPFLVSHYDEVYIVDQRYFELGVEDFIKENGITDLLILNNIFAVNTSLRIDELETIRDQEYTPYGLRRLFRSLHHHKSSRMQHNSRL